MKYLRSRNELSIVGVVVLLMIGLLAMVTQVISRQNLIGNAQVLAITPSVESDSYSGSGDIADDTAIWFNDADPTQSVIIGDNKADSGGGVGVFDLSGKLIQFRPDGKIGNVDLRKNFQFGAESITLVGANSRSNSTIVLYKLNPTTRLLEQIPGTRPTLNPNYGFCFYQSKLTNKFYAFVTQEAGGTMEQYELVVNGTSINTQKVRTITIGTQSEGCVADDDRAKLYVGEEDVAIWKYDAEPTAPTTRTAVDVVGNGHLTADIEGLSIVSRQDGTGYLFASSQGNSTYAVYSLEGNNTFIKNFTIAGSGTIDAVTETDGISSYFGNFSPTFPKGIFVAHDATNAGGATSNYKFVPLHLIVDLDTVPTSSPTNAPGTTVTPTPIVTSLVPTADTYVTSDFPTSNYATATTLQADASPVEIAYMKYDLSQFANDTLISAKLRMKVVNTSVGVQNIKSVASTSWTESGTTYNNRPAVGALIKSFTVGAVGSFVEVDITSAFASHLGQVVALAIDTSGSDGFDASSSNTVDKPTLILTTLRNQGPISTPIPTGIAITPTGFVIPTLTLTPTQVPTVAPTATPTPMPVQTVVPIADSFVKSDTASTNYGTNLALESDGSPIELAYMKYDLTTFSGKQLKSAKLRMKVTNSSPGIQNIRLVPNTSWTETGITYNNRPAVGSVFKTFPGGTAGNFVEVDITSGLLSSLGNVITLAIDSTNTDGFGFASRNNTVVNDRVRLLITVQ